MALADNRIVHDGEYNFLRAQHGEKWDQEDKEIDARLAEIREKNGGKRPNILYILIDDISYGQMGNRKMNYVMGIETPSINKFADEGLNLMRMYTEPSCTPTRAAFLTGRVDAADGGPRHAAEREVREEVGLDLSGAQRLGRLDDESSPRVHDGGGVVAALPRLRDRLRPLGAPGPPRRPRRPSYPPRQRRW